ncbi:polysaccharide biosynthesis tyrosine autokinase [Thalassoroseus pseudoceratinae]|uniref:polysaccharide biosynthesis tyrosine autokinase n=1 Tax=Thalassoroseus pseudoceratinae TaxID=2713176 RepID=UPI00141E4380|nr:polysaccharide biosynthesis tyrosine autokinase [Thalassoroseus pseudoceratinae]
MFDTKERKANFTVRKQTTLKLVKSRPVLTAALRDDAVANLPMVKTKEHPVDWLEKELTIGSSGTEFFTVSLSGEQPEEIPKIVNAVTQSFMDEVVVADSEGRLARLKELTDIAARVEENLELKRRELQRLMEASGTGSATTIMMEQEHDRLLEWRNLLKNQLLNTELELTKVETELSIREEKTGKEIEISDDAITVLLTEHSAYKSASLELKTLEGHVENKKETLAEGHPSLEKSQERLERTREMLDRLRDELRPQLVEEAKQRHINNQQRSNEQLKKEIHALQQLKSRWENELQAAKIQERDNGKQVLGLQGLEQEISRQEKMASALAEEIQRRKFEIANARDPIQVHQLATAPRSRSTRKRMMASAMSGVGAFGFAVFLIVGWDIYRRRISSITDVSRNLPMPLVGTIPTLPRVAVKGGGGRKNAQKAAFWREALKESIDASRTMLLRLAREEDLKVLTVTSACQGEGKTTLVCHLAMSLARSGKRVLLIDGDLRRPSTNKVFGLENGDGACEVLRGESTLSDVLQETSLSNLTMICAGQVDQAALDCLGSGILDAMTDQIRHEYDFILIDSAPVLPVSDTLMVVQHTDAVMLAIRKEVSRLGSVGAALDRLNGVGARVLGAVAIGLDDASSGYGGYNGSQYTYGTYNSVLSN